MNDPLSLTASGLHVRIDDERWTDDKAILVAANPKERGPGDEQTREHMRLFAAAPELLEAADYASGQWRCGDGEHRDAADRNWVPEACPGCRLRAAIQKATTP